MHRLAVLTDVHADLHALTDALASIARLGCDSIVCAGDIVDYGLFPDETLALLAERRIPTVRGNHDRWALEGRRNALGLGGGWELSRASKRFLGGLANRWSAVIEGVRVAVHHASPVHDRDGIYPETLSQDRARELLVLANADVLLVGHTHRSYAFHVDLSDTPEAIAGGLSRGLIANPGALLRHPADGSDHIETPGVFGVLELPSCTFTVHDAKSGASL